MRNGEQNPTVEVAIRKRTWPKFLEEMSQHPTRRTDPAPFSFTTATIPHSQVSLPRLRRLRAAATEDDHDDLDDAFLLADAHALVAL